MHEYSYREMIVDKNPNENSWINIYAPYEIVKITLKLRKNNVAQQIICTIFAVLFGAEMSQVYKLKLPGSTE